MSSFSRIFAILTMRVVLLLFLTINKAELFDEINCSPYVDYINTDPASFLYHPYVVKLNRCHGSVGAHTSPLERVCVPSAVERFNITVVVNFGVEKFVEMESHINCASKCRLDATHCNGFETWNERTCVCECPLATKPCPTPLMWSRSTCDCVCPRLLMPCSRKKEWNESTCKCECSVKRLLRCAAYNKTIDTNSCNCIVPQLPAIGCNKPRYTTGMVLLAVFIEAFALLIAYFFLYMYCYKHLCVRKRRKERHSEDGSKNDLSEDAQGGHCSQTPVTSDNGNQSSEIKNGNKTDEKLVENNRRKKEEKDNTKANNIELSNI